MPRFVILSGAGLSVASGLSTFRGDGGLWEGHDVTQVATPEAWFADRAMVRRFYDARRDHAGKVVPNPGHQALARLQRELGTDAVMLVTQNVDGLLEAAGCPEVLDMHGSLGRIRCERHEHHPVLAHAGPLPDDATCEVCGATMRPDIVWFGEVPRFLDRIGRALETAEIFMAVGTSGLVYPAAGFGRHAMTSGARTIELNPTPSGAPWFSYVIDRNAEEVLPGLVDRWLA